MIDTTYTEDIQGNCDVCLGSDCGPSGVRVTGTPVAIGQRCVEQLAKALPKAKRETFRSGPVDKRALRAAAAA